ncbi:F0F1 ATP synthase subunit delta [Paradesulfitobacterium ferrireducens]|uniref:F0F1 ATP synthase subunit delta n=1 Tax=Paradesulfitobacterium ferrireducens TaxID=2816476 RepID=UPI001A8F8991|nr:F0F1 ATP synthase subunit delta [Paradesulfitobacterium ferrireducens]
MLSGALARRYAQALFELAVETDSLDQIQEELQGLTELVQSNTEVEQVLYHPHISLTEKKSLMDKLVGDQVGETVRNFLHLLIDRRRQNLLPLIVREFTQLADDKRQVIEAKVLSAVSLTPSQEERLKKELSRLTGKDVRLVSELRPELIGGVMVQVGDRVFDGTVAHSLERMREELRKTPEKEPQGIGVR